MLFLYFKLKKQKKKKKKKKKKNAQKNVQSLIYFSNERMKSEKIK